MPNLEEPKLWQHIPTFLKVFLFIAILGTAMYSAYSGNWDRFVVCVPFVVALVPGYFELLPRGGMRHGSKCGCVKPAAACELGFWFELGQRCVLFMPILLMSIFLDSIFLFHHDLQQAMIETLLATLTAIIYSAVCVGCFYAMVKKFHQ